MLYSKDLPCAHFMKMKKVTIDWVGQMEKELGNPLALQARVKLLTTTSSQTY